jgi:hypothetical protein
MGSVYVEVDLSGSGSPPRLVEPEDFKSFKLVVQGAAEARRLDEALGALGHEQPGGGHAWLRIDGLRGLAGELSGDPSWSEGFDAMVAYAGTKGWLSSDGEEIRAHVVI